MQFSDLLNPVAWEAWIHAEEVESYGLGKT
mgnify:CR=1 FL=1